MREPSKNLGISAQEFYRSQKQLKMGTFEGFCDRGTISLLTPLMARFQAKRITSGTSRHPKDVPFVSTFREGCTVWTV